MPSTVLQGRAVASFYVRPPAGTIARSADRRGAAAGGDERVLVQARGQLPAEFREGRQGHPVGCAPGQGAGRLQRRAARRDRAPGQVVARQPRALRHRHHGRPGRPRQGDCCWNPDTPVLDTSAFC